MEINLSPYDKVIISHEPIETNNILNIHGHIHNEGLKINYPNLKQENHFCVSVEMIKYAPISWTEIKNKFRKEFK